MNESEFEKQARRAAIAFGVSSDVPAQMGRFPYAEVQPCCIFFESEHFRLDIYIRESPLDWDFHLSRGKYLMECVNWPVDPSVYIEYSLDDSHLMANRIVSRALCVLDFDVEAIEEWFNLEITAHEKLEWQLEFQRRLREEGLSEAS